MSEIYIIEHLEPELGKWCLIEYAHISKIVGKANLWFTNIKNDKDTHKLRESGKIFRESVSKLKLENACILDPEAKKTLTIQEAKNFKYFIFGGILGDFPPKKRTSRELTRFVKGEIRNIGKEQMSTDNAIYTVKQICRGKELTKLQFQDNLEIKFDKVMSLELPYRYNLVKGKPLISPELVRFLKKKKGF